MKALVIGSGGREHALAWKLAQSPHVQELYCAPGNGGIHGVAECVPIKVENSLELARFAEKLDIDLTVVGPEVPLSLGIADMFRKMGLRIFGPGADAAQLESSKIFAKQFMQRHGIPTADFQVCTSADEAKSLLASGAFGFPVVLKADGLAAGKGVLICDDEKEAIEGVDALMVSRDFGPAGERILIEKCLSGPEVSLMVICDGQRFLPLFPASDYKRAREGDQGPNTGGMGAYAPSVTVDRTLSMKMLTEVVGPTVQGMIEEGRPFRGLLYCGLMLTPDGPQVLEYNVRFGDPETQVLMALLDADLFELLYAAANGKMIGTGVIQPKGHAVTVVLASDGYPGSYEKGKLISGLEEAEALEGVTVFHAGTKKTEDGIITSGGRVLNVTAVAESLEKAIYRAYKAAEIITFEGRYYRKDIAHNAVS